MNGADSRQIGKQRKGWIYRELRTCLPLGGQLLVQLIIVLVFVLPLILESCFRIAYGQLVAVRTRTEWRVSHRLPPPLLFSFLLSMLIH